MAKQIWFKENCAIEALKYTRPVDFQKGSPSAEAAARRNGWFEEITSHMEWERESWTREKLIALVEEKKYKSIRQLQLDAAGAYKAIDRFKIMEEIRAMMPEYVAGSDKIIPLEEVILRIQAVHGDLVRIVDSTYKSLTKRATFVDKDYKEWETTPSSVIAGSSHPTRSKEKQKITNLGRYGKEHPMQNKALRDKADATVMKRHGVKNISSLKEVKTKKKETTFKNFGTEFPAQSDVVKEKMRNTTQDRFGVDNASQNHEIGLKQARAINSRYIRFHWKTGEELVCIGSYEAKTVDHFNSKQIDFHWQSQTFRTPNGKTYRPDAYLPDEDIWIEIKGWMRPDAQIKWDWFKTVYPTAQLWNKEKLKEIGIL